MHSFKLTTIIVNNTLVQQWADEIAKFAPTLKVLMYYGDGKKRARSKGDAGKDGGSKKKSKKRD